jgi:glycosyltransferase involved in cell wall biosynthesis
LDIVVVFVNGADDRVIDLGTNAADSINVPVGNHSIAAAGKPTIFVGSPIGEIARLIAHYRCGCTISPGDGEALVDCILALICNRERLSEMGARAREAFEAHWDSRQALAKWEEVIVAVGTQKRADSYP